VSHSADRLFRTPEADGPPTESQVQLTMTGSEAAHRLVQRQGLSWFLPVWGESLQVKYQGDCRVHSDNQLSISFDLGDEAEKGDDDPAVVRTVESLSAVGNDTPMSRQENEARSDGGTMSQ
jgi:hypothetical protein